MRATSRPVPQYAKMKNTAKSEVSSPRTILPWEGFLPSREDAGNKDRRELRRCIKSSRVDFKELLDEGKKRLEKAGQEQQLRERAEVVGRHASNELDDLLADLSEPSFSRRQNE